MCSNVENKFKWLRIIALALHENCILHNYYIWAESCCFIRMRTTQRYFIMHPRPLYLKDYFWAATFAIVQITAS